MSKTMTAKTDSKIPCSELIIEYFQRMLSNRVSFLNVKNKEEKVENF